MQTRDPQRVERRARRIGDVHNLHLGDDRVRRASAFASAIRCRCAIAGTRETESITLSRRANSESRSFHASAVCTSFCVSARAPGHPARRNARLNVSLHWLGRARSRSLGANPASSEKRRCTAPVRTLTVSTRALRSSRSSRAASSRSMSRNPERHSSAASSKGTPSIKRSSPSAVAIIGASASAAPPEISNACGPRSNPRPG